jgi:hypothetical protein
MKLLFAGQIPKELAFPEENEDAFELISSSERIILSDGASESFDSRTWARLLVSSSIKEADLDQNILATVIANYKAQYDYPSLSWSKQAAFVRGSFATLLIIEQFNEEIINLFGVGDSFAVLLNNGELVESFPYIQANEFSQRPVLLSTNASRNTFLESPDFISKRKKTWTIKEIASPILLCMTDAIGEWALRKWEEGNPVWQQLISLNNVTKLEELVVEERQRRMMRVDDTTLITVCLEKGREDELSIT